MTADVFDLEFSSLRLPAGPGKQRRDRFGKSEHHDPDYDARYDTDTLIYDCFEDHKAGEIVLLGPPFMNFEPWLAEASYVLDGRAVAVKEVRHLSRCSILALDAAEGRELSVTHRHFGGRLTVGRSYVDAFAGLNGIYTISLDNRLEWIRDWLHYYVSVHGLEAVVLTDNGSTTYDPRDLHKLLKGVAGLRRAAILRGRFPFGPTAENRSAYNSLFLQRSMAEMGRLRFFARARAVVNADIDEFFHSYRGRSIFDAAVASETGYVRADAEWVYALAPGPDGFARHAEHSHVSATGRPKANRKWALVPDGPQAGKQWMTHFLDNRHDPVDRDFRLWHFRQVSTGWKFDRQAVPAEALVESPDLIEAMARAFRSP
ncbi:MAG: hypothetical protein AAGA70_00475 [Pseudomonadota bacterium]